MGGVSVGEAGNLTCSANTMCALPQCGRGRSAAQRSVLWAQIGRVCSGAAHLVLTPCSRRCGLHSRALCARTQSRVPARARRVVVADANRQASAQHHRQLMVGQGASASSLRLGGSWTELHVRQRRLLAARAAQVRVSVERQTQVVAAPSASLGAHTSRRACSLSPLCVLCTRCAGSRCMWWRLLRERGGGWGRRSVQLAGGHGC